MRNMYACIFLRMYECCTVVQIIESVNVYTSLSLPNSHPLAEQVVVFYGHLKRIKLKRILHRLDVTTFGGRAGADRKIISKILLVRQDSILSRPKNRIILDGLNTHP